MKTVSLDIHDLSIIRNRWDLLLRLKEHYPDFKLSAFYIPFDHEYELSSMRINRERELARLKEHLDWIQLIPHGITHAPREFETADKWTMKMALQGIDEEMQKQGLPYEKGFCAPYWLWSQGVVDALDEAGWWGAVDRNQPKMLRTRRYYEYSHDIAEPFWLSSNPVLKLHGHMTLPSANNLEDCFLNLTKLPADTKWVYVTDFIEEAKA